MVRETPDLIRSVIDRVRAVTIRDFGVNLIPAATDPDLLEAELEVVIAEQVAAVTLFWDLRSDIVRRLCDSGCLVVCQVGSVREAEEAAVAGAHIVIAQGFEAGGHVRGTTNLADLVPDGGVREYSSPACMMHEVSDAYMGYAGKDELTVFLNELLEAERAGARVALESAHEAGSGPLATLLRTVQRDEARWCAMLRRHVKALGEKPSSETGAFYGKAMAITDLRERIAFLNRGQGWVVRKLREILPRVRDDDLHASISEMLRSHVANIDLVNGFR